ncbi:hypothetical protein P170DRAFT_211578 [Aspergillus steynii IBT 23096]|uniref:F-box domain-containing protein n=1 Tax=Aspergillus steynii IBT 23096 TaxID=1392250 RepID=A0A2I2G688_9EURO|nr:uncharacterized protein P170DRAFT_211578 [Aspergillus steynii IBT 23096]PLB48396.1 hypothetical protein P170DRAFT_211578 [Aspergillus steynii IBT 23096]
MPKIQKTSESTYIFLKIEDSTLDDVDQTSYRTDLFDLDLQPPAQGLGALEILPLEMIQMALILLDMQSLTDFRRVNKSARLITNSIPQYRHIRVHAPALIRASLNIETARFFSCQELYEKLCTAECDSCGDFGGYIYLVTCRRVCFLCFTEKTEYLPLLRTDAIRKFGLYPQHLPGLPCMKSFPGCYSPLELRCRQRQTLFDYSAARQAGIVAHGTIHSMEKYASETLAKRLATYNSKLSTRRTGGARPRPPRLEDSFDGQCSNPKRFMGIIRAPFFNQQTGSLEWGLHCIACESHHYHRPLHWRREFTVKGFQDHISECGEIKEGKHISQYFIRPPSSQFPPPSYPPSLSSILLSAHFVFAGLHHMSCTHVD